MDFFKDLLNRSKKIDKTIILPEANIDMRVRRACEQILRRRLGKIVVFGKNSEFPSIFTKSPNCTIIDIENYENLNLLTENLYQARKSKDMTLTEAKKLIKDPIYFATMLVKSGVADGIVAGASWTTANTIRPALQLIKTAPDARFVTSATVMLKKSKRPLVFADVGLNANPNSEELGEIAVATAKFVHEVLNITPKVAMLSYSTKGSASGELVEKVKNALTFTSNSPYLIDGEMQLDSAIDKATGIKKGINPNIAGEANVLIFPDLNAGNIGYKLASHLGGYTAIGPIMIGINKPVNDLSRGSNINEILYTYIITKLMA